MAPVRIAFPRPRVDDVHAVHHKERSPRRRTFLPLAYLQPDVGDRMAEAEIGVIGGSGFYELLEEARELRRGTPYGPASDVRTVGEGAGRQGAVLRRHCRH